MSHNNKNQTLILNGHRKTWSDKREKTPLAKTHF